MSGKRIGARAVARCQAWLPRPVIYDGLVWGWARDPLEWFRSDTPSPCEVPARPTSGSVPRGLTEGGLFKG
jgi:hypothetical protein